MNQLVSIIVPVYNVQYYLQNCIESILCQTYKNLEILLIDDGSTDCSGSICERYANIDARIKVIHKKNGGLSDARNVGIDVSTGRYIMFVDSDDYMPRNAVEYLYDNINKYNADISVGKLKTTKLLDEKPCNIGGMVSKLSKKESICELLYARIYSVSAPGKLYRADLFENIRFPVGRFYEDMFTTYKVFNKSNCIIYGNQIVYYYYHRNGSIMTCEFSERKLDLVEALDDIKKSIPLYDYGAKGAYASQTVESMYHLLNLHPNRKVIHDYCLWERIKIYRKEVIRDKRASKRIRAYALLSYCGLNMSVGILNWYYHLKWR